MFDVLYVDDTNEEIPGDGLAVVPANVDYLAIMQTQGKDTAITALIPMSRVKKVLIRKGTIAKIIPMNEV